MIWAFMKVCSSHFALNKKVEGGSHINCAMGVKFKWQN